RMNFPQYHDLEKNPHVEKKWFGKNWWWVIPVGLAIIYAGADYFSDGEFDGNFTKVTRVTIYDDGDPNDPNVDHNPNAGIFGKAWEKPLVNDALNADAKFATGPPRGLIIGLGFL